MTGDRQTLELLCQAWQRDIVEEAAKGGTPVRASVLAGDLGDETIVVITIAGPRASLDVIAQRELGADAKGSNAP